MNIDKAIKLNQESHQSLVMHQFDAHAHAILLGNYALERLRYARTHPAYDYHLPLPGED